MKFNYDQYDPVQCPFNPRAEGLNLGNALCLAAASQLAYEESASTVRQVLETWGFNQTAAVEWTGTIDAHGGAVVVDTQGFVCAGEHALLIVFRGSEPSDLRDWLTDAMIHPMPFPGGPGQVHTGFWMAFDAVEPQLKAALADLRHNQQPIWIAGHSLGGALAVMCAAWLRGKEGLPVRGLYTFGQPRVGDWAFADAFDRDFAGRAFRFVNNNDIVPQLPPPGPIFRYRHIRALRYIDSDGVLHAELPWWRIVYDMARGALKDVKKLGVADGIRDHDMAGYIDHLKRLAVA